MAVLEGGGLLALAAAAVIVWRIGQRVPLGDLVAIARVTGSPRACLGFILFCLRAR